MLEYCHGRLFVKTFHPYMPKYPLNRRKFQEAQQKELLLDSSIIPEWTLMGLPVHF